MRKVIHACEKIFNVNYQNVVADRLKTWQLQTWTTSHLVFYAIENVQRKIQKKHLTGLCKSLMMTRPTTTTTATTRTQGQVYLFFITFQLIIRRQPDDGLFKSTAQQWGSFCTQRIARGYNPWYECAQPHHVRAGTAPALKASAHSKSSLIKQQPAQHAEHAVLTATQT